MNKKLVNSIYRTGTSKTATRRLVVTQGTGKNAVTTVLSTPIEKIEMGLSFRNGRSRTPIEQYMFRVGKRHVERFADAAALVLKKHHIALDENAKVPAYVQHAFNIMNGNAAIREASEA